MRKALRLQLGLAVLSLGLIGAGVAMVCVPAALITVGGLLWIDMTVGAWSDGRNIKPNAGRGN